MIFVLILLDGLFSGNRIAAVFSDLLTGAGPMNFFSRLTAPAAWILSAATYAILKILGIRDQENKVDDAGVDGPRIDKVIITYAIP